MASISKAFTQKETRNKILFTLFILVLYRIGTFISVPGIPFHSLSDSLAASSNSGMAMLDMFTGGALSKMSLLSLGIMPYITASIVMQLMALVIPKIAKWQKEGGEGRKQIIKWTRILTIFLGLINAIGYDLMFQGQYGIAYNSSVPAVLSNALVIFSMTIGVIILMWMCELITQHGIGNGMSIVIFTNVVSSVPSAIVSSLQTSGTGTEGIFLTILIALIIVVVLPLVVFVERSQRRVPVKSFREGANSRYARKANTSYIPIPWDVAGVYALIFASCFITIPVTLAAFFPDVSWLNTLSNTVSSGPISWAVNFVLVILFFFFMADVNFKADDIAENLKKSDSVVPGVRPGEHTADYLRSICHHLALFGAIFIGILAVASSASFYYTNNSLLQTFGGTSILIMISVGMQFMSAIEQNVRASDPESVLRRLG